MHRIFIDGQAGTTGLQIHERLSARADIELLEIDPKDRKDVNAKKAIIAAADVVLLCLPDEAAIETVALDDTGNTRFIDASTAHRVNPDWVYGMPELAVNQRADIASARLVSNPGCYPTGFLAAIRPLSEAGLIDTDALITISAISGYSGGGRTLIEKYEQHNESAQPQWHVRPYALALKHKHVAEMTHYAGLSSAPVFLPVVGNFHQGMLVSIPLFKQQFKKTVSPKGVQQALAERYEGESCINVAEANSDEALLDGFLDPEAANGTNRIDLFVHGHEEQILIVARLDNLGKGASGAAVQNLNLMLQIPELEGLFT
jgi:N-acetyl-gamma-glutamyl-phosphate reductase